MAVLAGHRSAHHKARIGMASVALAVAGGVCHAQVDEHTLKAAFVYNMVAFAQWQHGGTGTLTICLQANAGLEAAVTALAGRTVSGRPLAVTRDASGAVCDVLVHDAGTLVAATADTLVICDACQLPNGTSAIALVREGNKIRFDVDATRAKTDGIVFSSQLLRLARRVL
jgi:hypothetical protein